MSLSWLDIRKNIFEIKKQNLLPFKILGAWEAKGESNISLPFILYLSSNVNLEEYGFWYSLTNGRTWFSLIKNRIDRGKEELFSIKIRKEIIDLEITNIQNIEEDRTLFLSLGNEKVVAIELFPGRPNLLIVSTQKNDFGEVLFSKQPTPDVGSIYKSIDNLKIVSANSYFDFEKFSIELNNEYLEEFQGELQLNKLVWNEYRQNERVDARLKELRGKSSSLKDTIKKLNDLHKGLENSLSKNIKNLELKKHGEILQANFYLFKDKKLAKEIMIDDIVVKIDNTKTIAQNLENIFSKYKKAKNSIPEIEKLIEKNKQKIDEATIALQKIVTEIEKLDSKEKIEIQKNSKELKEKKAKQIEFPCKTVDVRDGVKGYIGRNEKENEFVVTKLAHPNDYWFHVKNKAGAHGILKLPKNQTPTKDDLILMAKLVSKYSGIKSGNKVDVDYVQKKFVKKIKGQSFKVTYSQNKSIFVEVD